MLSRLATSTLRSHTAVSRAATMSVRAMSGTCDVVLVGCGVPARGMGW